MKSRKKTNNKSHIVIAFGTGIAAARSLEAAMLFSRAGFDVHPIFLEQAHKWLGAEAVKEACNHSIACYIENTNEPKWFVPTWKGYKLAIIFEPNDEELKDICLNEQNNKAIAHIVKLSQHVIICNSKEIPEFFVSNHKIKYFTIPQNQGLYSDFFLNLFSYSIKLLFNEKERLSYCSETSSQLQEWQKELIEALNANGINLNDSCNIKIDAKSQDTFDIELPNGTKINATICNKGIIVSKNGTERLLPEVSGQKAYDRLVNFIITENQRV